MQVRDLSPARGVRSLGIRTGVTAAIPVISVQWRHGEAVCHRSHYHGSRGVSASSQDKRTRDSVAGELVGVASGLLYAMI